MASEDSPGRVMQIAMSVHDLGRAVRFYRDVLRVPFLFEAPPALAFFDLSGIRLMLSAVEGEPHHASVLYLEAVDIDQLHATLTERGVEFVRPPQSIAKLPDRDVLIAPFRDSEGNLLALMEERRR